MRLEENRHAHTCLDWCQEAHAQSWKKKVGNRKQTERRTLIIEEVRIEMKHRIVIVPERPLSKEQRRNFKKENPGYKLDFMSRYPGFPLFVSVISLLLVICKPILNDMLLKFIHS